MRFGLPEKTIDQIIGVFKKHKEIEKAVLYGSRAKGTNSSGSDIDLTLIGEALNLSILNKLENEIDDLLLPYTLDISLYKQIKNKNLLEHIERVGIVFYNKTESKK